jgi:hypothetical protein
MERDQAKGSIPVFDIHTATYLELKGIAPELTLQGTRVVFEFPATDRVYAMLREYQNNPSIPVLNFVNILRRLRSKMLSMRATDQ